jgi:hypothetical protein
LIASHIPITLRKRGDANCQIGHVARANNQWRALDGKAEALAIFHGPHAYVSRTWYATPPAVPTWNYAAVHVYGKPAASEDRGPCCPASTPSVIRVASRDRPGADVTLFQAESAVSYASGHLIFADDETLMARPFDLEAGQLRGDAFLLARRVTKEVSRYVGASASENGTLVYGQAGADVARQLTWFDRTGRELGTLSDAARYSGLALSPDERRVAVTLETGAPNNVDIWLIDIARNIRSRLTVYPGQERSPVWSPDSARIAFQSSRSRQPIAVRQTLSTETGADELLLEGPGNFTMTPSGWSSDGQFIAYTTRGSNVWILPLFGDRKPFAFAETRSSKHRPCSRRMAGGSHTRATKVAK